MRGRGLVPWGPDAKPHTQDGRIIVGEGKDNRERKKISKET